MFIPPNKTIEVEVGGETFSFKPEDYEIRGDLEKEIRYAAGSLLFIFRLNAQAKRKAEILEAQYRHWKAQQIDDLSKLGKLPEWKVRNVVESQSDFLNWKKKIARANETVATIQGWIEASRAKIELLRTLRADRRKEYDTAGEVDPIGSKKRYESNAETVRKALRRDKNGKGE